MPGYVGRFAPSPSGALHQGSLLAALASFLQARSQRGRWLIRVEDIDPPREPEGAAQAILACLEAHRLIADEPPSFQSLHRARYDEALGRLERSGRLYGCECTRASLRQASTLGGGPAYAGTCRAKELPHSGNALRLRLATATSHHFEDAVLGRQSEDLRQTTGDFVLRRRDGLYAYQLAVVVDDAAQGVTEIVRGSDLLDNTARQIHLQQALGLPQPNYCHIPILLDDQGRKLSKQNHAPQLDNGVALANLQAAWASLGQQALPYTPDCERFISAAIRAWRLDNVPCDTIVHSQLS